MADEQNPEVTAAPEAANDTPASPARGEAKGDRGGQKGDRRGGHGSHKGGNRDRDRGQRREREERDEESLTEKLVSVNRVSKTVKGGKRFGFAALVVVGDQKGRVGHGAGKAREVPEAISKATAAARRNMVRVQLREGRTVHHDVRGIFGAGEVVLRTAPSGTGIIAGGPMRAVFEAVGVHDVVAKSVGSSNPHNMVKATFDALVSSSSPRSVAARRGKKVSDILGKGSKEYADQQ